ncbi:hypothetical protein AYI68_g5515 [Smittium mucronatum]|uniref:Protein kinase domain-containing protein n=1 Tax=Smittium mucronatum TaxID=133383 RepID=A0A1R0GU71_9FUNG|nr:hypothetical protein AYI68_g5515 [Smittium mucronatum]
MLPENCIQYIENSAEPYTHPGYSYDTIATAPESTSFRKKFSPFKLQRSKKSSQSTITNYTIADPTCVQDMPITFHRTRNESKITIVEPSPDPPDSILTQKILGTHHYPENIPVKKHNSSTAFCPIPDPKSRPSEDDYLDAEYLARPFNRGPRSISFDATSTRYRSSSISSTILLILADNPVPPFLDLNYNRMSKFSFPRDTHDSCHAAGTPPASSVHDSPNIGMISSHVGNVSSEHLPLNPDFEKSQNPSNHLFLKNPIFRSSSEDVSSDMHSNSYFPYHISTKNAITFQSILSTSRKDSYVFTRHFSEPLPSHDLEYTFNPSLLNNSNQHPTQNLNPVTTINESELLDLTLFATGDSGDSFTATYVPLTTTVCVKVIRNQDLDRKRILEAEINILGRLECEFIYRFFGTCQSRTDSTLFVTEYMDMGSATDLFELGQLDVTVSSYILECLLKAVQADILGIPRSLFGVRVLEKGNVLYFSFYKKPTRTFPSISQTPPPPLV